MADTQILRAGGPAPFDYLIPANAELVPKVVSAIVDGTGAAGSFEPTLIIESDAGEIVAEIAAPSMSAGASGRTSWFPEGDVATGGGIEFDTDNEGGWLDVTTNAQDGGGLGVNVTDKTGGGILLASQVPFFPQAGELLVSGDGFLLSSQPSLTQGATISASAAGGDLEISTSSSYPIVIETRGGAAIQISSTDVMTLAASNGLEIQGNPAQKVGFFGVGPVAQQATPTTLAQVIALLQAYGLAA